MLNQTDASSSREPFGVGVREGLEIETCLAVSLIVATSRSRMQDSICFVEVPELVQCMSRSDAHKHLKSRVTWQDQLT